MKDTLETFPFQDYKERQPKKMGPLDKRFGSVHMVYQAWKQRIEKELREYKGKYGDATSASELKRDILG